MADQRRRRLREEARAKGETASALRRCLAAWTVFVTNIPSELLCVTKALVLGRARWQVELIFKLCKSQGDVDTLRAVLADALRGVCEMNWSNHSTLVVAREPLADAAWSLTKAA